MKISPIILVALAAIGLFYLSDRGKSHPSAAEYGNEVIKMTRPQQDQEVGPEFTITGRTTTPVTQVTIKLTNQRTGKLLTHDRAGVENSKFRYTISLGVAHPDLKTGDQLTLEVNNLTVPLTFKN